MSRIAFTLVGAREAGVEDVADDEDEHRRAEGEDRRAAGRASGTRGSSAQPARPRRRACDAHVAHPHEPADERAEDDRHDQEEALEERPGRAG